MRYFTIHELTNSPTAARLGIRNEPSAEEIVALTELANNVLDPARSRFGRPVMVTSGYRSPALNRAVGGAANSQHSKGEAADLSTGSAKGNGRLARIIFEQGMFDQLILENATSDGTQCDWVHVSYAKTGNRRQTLIKCRGCKGYKAFGF
ncbi:MAG: peptidase M15 [Bacteroidales bacterium]|nr:peptidase M15 [Bacteroidales bacterium]